MRNNLDDYFKYDSNIPYSTINGAKYKRNLLQLCVYTSKIEAKVEIQIMDGSQSLFRRFTRDKKNSG